MKKTWVALAIGLLSVNGWAQGIPGQAGGSVSTTPTAAPVNTSLSFEAKSVSSGGATKVKNTGSSGLLHENAQGMQTHQSITRLEVKVRNFGTTPGQAHLDCYFVAISYAQRQRFIWDTAGRDVSVPAGDEKPELFESKPLTEVKEQTFRSVTTNDVFGNTTVTRSTASRTSGSKTYGWIVRLMSGDRVLKVQASSSELESIARDPASLLKMQRDQPAIPAPLGSTPSPFRSNSTRPTSLP